jgi:hypothetical protein
MATCHHSYLASFIPFGNYGLSNWNDIIVNGTFKATCHSSCHIWEHGMATTRNIEYNGNHPEPMTSCQHSNGLCQMKMDTFSVVNGRKIDIECLSRTRSIEWQPVLLELREHGMATCHHSNTSNIEWQPVTIENLLPGSMGKG